MPRALLAHDRQDSAGDVHRAYEARRRQLALDLLRRQLLEVAGIKAGSIVDWHVDAAEPVNSGPHVARMGICSGMRALKRGGEEQREELRFPRQLLRRKVGPSGV